LFVKKCRFDRENKVAFKKMRGKGIFSLAYALNFAVDIFWKYFVL
tara:strand:- start:1079 stop:1213 length:135 start_codon:yes stop_codon:yes gene_type:complete